MSATRSADYETALILADEALAQAQRELPGSHPDRPDLLSIRTRLNNLLILTADEREGRSA